MPYLIDANNLAGKLNLLDEDNFDKKLIEIIKEYIKQTDTRRCQGHHGQRKITLVFEGTDSMGDKAADGSLIIIRAPRDDYYKNADVKIIELINNAEKPEQLVVISDDREILEAARKAGCLIKKASYFAQILEYNANIAN
ncbi:hypothetical protein L6267_02590 [Candidatus Parcubacteria bacterium]|nr:hypothetical protein [Candidatus Parcubacteria bacterium]